MSPDKYSPHSKIRAIFNGLPVRFLRSKKRLWPHRLVVRTPDSHSGNRGAIPREVTKTVVDNLVDNLTQFFIRLISICTLQYEYHNLNL